MIYRKANLQEIEVGQIIYVQDILNENNKIPVNFRGFINSNLVMVVRDGYQMSIDTNRLFVLQKENI
jgi:hypothetical protein